MLRNLLALLFPILVGTAQAAEHFDGQTWWSTVKVLADDQFEGRETGSAGERQAQVYIVQQLKALGTEPNPVARSPLAGELCIGILACKL